LLNGFLLCFDSGRKSVKPDIFLGITDLRLVRAMHSCQKPQTSHQNQYTQRLARAATHTLWKTRTLPGAGGMKLHKRFTLEIIEEQSCAKSAR